MTPIKPSDWLVANQRYLSSALGRIRGLLEAQAVPGPSLNDRDLETPPALENLRVRFGLSDFETDALLLCAGVELDSRIASLCGEGLGDAGALPTFGLFLARLPDAHWTAVLPGAPLRYWRLMRMGNPAETIVRSPLRIDERILHYLVGISYLDDPLTAFIEPCRTDDGRPELVPSHQATVEQAVLAWVSAHDAADQEAGDAGLPVIQLHGNDAVSRQEVAQAVCRSLALDLNVMQAAALPPDPVERALLLRLWERETLLGRPALLLVVDGTGQPDAQVQRWIDAARYPLIVSTRERLSIRNCFVRSFEVAHPTAREQSHLWRASLGPVGAELNGMVDSLVSQFDLSSRAIRSLVGEALNREGTSVPGVSAFLWQACANFALPHLGELARRIHPVAAWDDLILPLPQKQVLEDIALHVRQRMKVYETWGFAARSSRGLGISALFAGPSGTGKTMAAEVLANTLRLELFSIDLSQVVSKYIGETEKNLRQVFDAAEESGAILFFDEADALFGKRTEVKDSHDRYANIEVNYLLQRMEAYRGLAILATNRKEALDQAFMRRLRFIVGFPFPAPHEREQIWNRIFPDRTPRGDLDYAQLAQMNVTGGSIRNIAMYAAFLAAEEGMPVKMDHVLRASRQEFAKLERAWAGAELGAFT